MPGPSDFEFWGWLVANVAKVANLSLVPPASAAELAVLATFAGSHSGSCISTSGSKLKLIAVCSMASRHRAPRCSELLLHGLDVPMFLKDAHQQAGHACIANRPRPQLVNFRQCDNRLPARLQPSQELLGQEKLGVLNTIVPTGARA
jgi:hypothetical protein